MFDILTGIQVFIKSMKFNSLCCDLEFVIIS